MLIELALHGRRGVGAAELLQAPDPHLHEVARFGGEGGAAVEPGQRLGVAAGVVGVPGAAFEQLPADVAALLGVEIGVGGGTAGARAVARREQRQRAPIGRVVPTAAGGGRQHGVESVRGLRPAGSG